MPAERLALGPVADDDEQRARIVEAREGIDEVAVALPASQRRDDADDARVRRHSERASSLVARDRSEARDVASP